MDIHDFAESKKLRLRQIMDFTSDVNPVGPSNKAKHAIRKGAKDLIFPPDEKIRRLKRYICKREQVGEETIFFGLGLEHILSILVQTFRPASVALVSPVSRRYSAFLAGRGVHIAAVPPTKEWGLPIDVESLVKTAKEADTILLANPHDVTGAILPAEELISLIKETDRLGKTLVIDESYIDYTEAESPVREVVASHMAMIIRSFSLFHALAGLPIGYMMGPAESVMNLNGCITPPRIGSLAYEAAYASLKDKGYGIRTFRFIEEEKRFVIDQLKKFNLLDVLDTPCNFLLLKADKLPADLDGLLQKRAILIDRYDDGTGGTYIKFPVKSHKFNARFIKALKSVMGSSSDLAPREEKDGRAPEDGP